MENQRTIKLYRARLNTGGKTPEQIKASFDGSELSEEEIQDWIKAYELVNGIEVVVMRDWTDQGYCLVGWEKDDDKKIRDFVYQAEQDPWFGTYIDEREEFIKDWESEEYSPDGSMVFDNKDVEIIEELKQKQG